MNLQILFEEQTKLLHKVNLDKKRYLYSKINWSLKSIGILGQRGLGKTTMMLQHIKENFTKVNSALYVSLDNPYMQSVSLFEFAKFFEQHGGEVLFVDEVHKYEDWSTHIKNIYDTLELKVVFSGSSILQISQQNSDLSRRSIVYTLENLSFREYLELLDIYKFESFTLENILENHIPIAQTVVEHIKPLMHFKEYLQYGAYPFILEDKEVYHQKIIQMINLILETDLPHINHIDISQIAKLKKLLYLLATNVPFIPNITDIAKATNISRPKVYDYLEYLERAKVINSIKSKEKGYNIMAKPEKLFMQNTNISYAITASLDTGSAREAFFVNQIKNALFSQTRLIDDRIFSSKKGDFLVNDKYTFEVGGKNKDFSQIKDIKNSYLVLDDIEVGYGAKIPLWLFGFLY
ncbi:MAG: AAA family ATPase [Epsilonproteobacteria bacterium]|nr:AAA family ATPase [Campylobacterota bacterium]OIO15589.1 MAG: AAA family ATPase [Helicobacteraceae bacterium CG1_02_36_14]PIP09411.1 MAG: AAA family ATPase [Sulfurimonas sp. CG23_combo_of_CG06-09_8_20_14_all_36_33]PIS26327.1 MAG: AAA family ATPase [Sulfurimonas sp. CG08_land_8_20_14_0_20_36_33]PIU33726.1 MAG: AAA family ATPase [Sulfurimonas sp. CG07_land_8_20_14_0_80_36_56]PIV04774.1 MAG: AAA family ATPase [Sulfurimonas sp. CG03_land_8_20_14_0_80_36_25]PIV35203.1 MAG: AAA family ATPase [Su